MNTSEVCDVGDVYVIRVICDSLASDNVLWLWELTDPQQFDEQINQSQCRKIA